ncbi:hypothetical protein [Granulicatella adiacens]
MTYTAIDNSRSVIQHYGKKGMKWRKNRMENYDVDAVDVASADDLHKDDADLAYIKSVKDTQALNGPADYKTLEKIHGKNKVTREIMAKFQKNAYGKLIDQKVKSRTDRWNKLRDKARKVNKQSTLNIGNGSPRI